MGTIKPIHFSTLWIPKRVCHDEKRTSGEVAPQSSSFSSGWEALGALGKQFPAPPEMTLFAQRTYKS
jgi:hypothetical protein